ncbi:hypothetical protein Ade02nite_84150 [Paractinoplanes deccanensis]|uniref:Glycosyltransferase RgtA/B/C/D-like domain-containing protein n=1 Tax=Paractinoplanes deccanensis TaxID=113561 RepID=A0ABQ3YIG0_9ACTN|nr:hypothetical protein [Actinoplanes deccanensis]GID79774.1 hypothetical protein Ade02nite_84150 [Actinoplanes deccanensis]
MNTLHGRTARTAGLVAAAIAALAAVVVASRPDLNGDVRYALGGLQTAGGGGVSIWDIFVSRPLAYKLLMAALDQGRLLFGDGMSLDAAKLVIRIETYVLVVAVVALLFVGVRRLAGWQAAAGIAGATGLTLLVAPPWHFLEPDWAGALAAVLAVGAACAPRRPWLGAVLGGFAAMVVVAVKASTFPIALIALLVIFVLDRRRAAWTALSTVAWVGVWFVLMRVFQPWEWTWLSDLANLVHSHPQGIHIADLRKLRFAIGDAAVLSPVLVLAPAAAAALVSRVEGRRRWLFAAIAVVAGLLSLAPAYGQGEFFNYHFAGSLVLAGGVWGAAFALRPGFRVPLVVATVLVTVLSLVLLRQPASWRLDHAQPVIWAYQIGALALAVAAWFLAERTRVALPWAAGVVALTFALLPAVLPGYPYTFSTYNYNIRISPSGDAPLAALGERLGPDTPVLYLTYGAINYGMGNPTTCRYPSPLWLQRGAVTPRMRDRPSYADNLRCLTEASDARYLIVQTTWFSLPKSAPDVRALIDERFDCSPAARVPAPPQILVCPARA